MKAKHLKFPLNRPQYVSVSEGYISALAWSLFEPLPKQEGKKQALRYSFESSAVSRDLVYKRTEPTAKDDFTIFAGAMASSGLSTDDDGYLLALAAAKSIIGVKSEKGKFTPASPMTPVLALLQNNEGIQGSANPPATAEILESIFRLGNSETDVSSAATLWAESAYRRLEIDPILKGIDSAMCEVAFGTLPVRRAHQIDVDDLETEWVPLLAESPFAWFAEAWKKLNSKIWVDNLPARVWTDWATTLLRTGYGTSILWECAWYESLGRAVISGNLTTVQEIIKNMDPTLPWRSASDTAEIRDLSSKIKVRCQRAFEIRTRLDRWLKEDSNEELPVEEALVKMHLDSNFKSGLAKDLQAKSNSNLGKGLREAIRYALLIREESGSNADYYGLLRNAGTRYLFPEPAIEWITVMASLSCDTPGSTCNLGDVKSFLRKAGLEPDLRDLVALLEKSGMARGSADAEEGLKVEAAFKGVNHV